MNTVPSGVKKGVCQLLTLNRFGVQQWLKTFDTIICDADGVLWIGSQAIEGASETFNAIRAMGKKAFICTNHSSTSREVLCAKAQNLNFLISMDEMLSSSSALARYLQERKFEKKVFIIGAQGVADELDAAGIQHLPIEKDTMLGSTMLEHARLMPLDPEVGAVAVGVDEHFNVPKLMKACSYLIDRKVLFLATNQDRSLRVAPDCFIPGAGVMIAAVQSAAKRPPFTCGKPNPFMCLHLVRDGIIKPERTLMVGDTLYTDVQFGYNCGFKTLLVGTGNSSLSDVTKVQESKQPFMYQQVPDLYLPKLSDLLKFLPSRNG